MHLQYGDGNVELHIRDDGRGFDPENIPSGHFGLSIMRERAEVVGAKLSIISQPGEGAEIVICWVENSKEASL
jgi:nitrate/nitrite-specific signal transduction histidine kinase